MTLLFGLMIRIATLACRMMYYCITVLTHDDDTSSSDEHRARAARGERRQRFALTILTPPSTLTMMFRSVAITLAFVATTTDAWVVPKDLQKAAALLLLEEHS